MTAHNLKVEEFKHALASEADGYGVNLSAQAMDGLSDYYELLNSWNTRLHLVAPCSPHQFATRHVLESLMLLSILPTAAKVADVGSGAGLPILPCLIVRPEISATLIDSSKKKAVFLREVINRTKLSESTTVIAERFEDITAPEADFVTCRALEHFETKLQSLLKWSPSDSTLLFFGGPGLREQLTHLDLNFKEVKIRNSERRYLFVIEQHG
jgi:16S rRNA (guanine527-N7)-methyltransferase